ncbi:hypothetical protein [Desulfocicer vacuolatum]|uniref:hypothetical protein n=1 Tax=Desulfocicer vacuolatum TaxID=2298 RepID=UPI001BB05BB3|nr:hypothetical protein [Desulfocicer vacuolatum]
MKYSVNLWSISTFVVGRAGSEYGPPVAVICNTPQTGGVFQILLWVGRGQNKVYLWQLFKQKIKDTSKLIRKTTGLLIKIYR